MQPRLQMQLNSLKKMLLQAQLKTLMRQSTKNSLSQSTLKHSRGPLKKMATKQLSKISRNSWNLMPTRVLSPQLKVPLIKEINSKEEILHSHRATMCLLESEVPSSPAVKSSVSPSQEQLFASPTFFCSMKQLVLSMKTVKSKFRKHSTP